MECDIEELGKIFTTIPYAAEEHNVSDPWIRELIARGAIKTGRIGGITVIRRADVAPALAEPRSRYHPPRRLRQE